MTRLEALERLALAARPLKAARDEREARVHAMQEAARLARAGGPRGQDAIREVERKHPIAYDIGDVTEDICDALDALDRAAGGAS